MAALYDVFISHCGEDKIPLALPIYEELNCRGISAFLDMKEMPVGDVAATTMLDAVDSSRIGLLILSPEFGAKKWPMLELERFLDIAERASKRTRDGQMKFLKLIPVFYRLPVCDCKEGAIFKKHPELLQEHGLMDRLIQGDASIEKIVQKLREVARLTGIENKHGATNDDTDEMKTRRAELTKNICDEIEGALFGGSTGNRPVSNVTSTVRTERTEVSRSRDVFQASWYVPPNAEEVELNFSGTSLPSTALTPEAKVMLEALGGTADTEAEAYTGAYANIVADPNSDSNTKAMVNVKRKQVVVIKGDGGVGKSCILRGLGRQNEVKDKFDGGVYFLSLGMEATEATLIKELLQILRMTGAKSLAEGLRTEESLSVVLNSFGEWMRGKRFLLLLDDLWDRKEMRAGLMSGMIGMIEQGSGSALVVTTRFNSIGSRGRMVEVKAREPQSAEARSMLLRYAGYSEGEAVESGVEKAMAEILRIGGGLPVCLAVMGRSVAQLVQYCGGDRRLAWKKHCAAVSSNREDVVKTGVDEYVDLWTTLSASVEVLEEVDGNGKGSSWKWSYGEMHRGLCVFEKPVAVSLEVVGRLWGMEEGDVWKVVKRFADVGLGTLEVKGEGEKDILRLHDLIHDFSVVCAESAGESAVWHRRLLEGYGEVVGVDEDGRDERDGGGRRDGRGCREWWKVESDEYMFRNVSRHLIGGKRVEELERVLMRGEWAMARQRGGRAGLWKEDFCKWAGGIEDEEEIIEDVDVRKRGLCLIKDAMLESWGYLGEDASEFGYQMWGRLVKEVNGIVQEFLKSVAKCQGKPWVKPLTAIWPRPGSRKVRAELFLGGEVKCITWVGGSKYAVVVGKEVIVVDVEDIRIVSRCVGHKDDVLSVIGSAESARLLSCSRDGTVRQWDVESGKELDMVRLNCIARKKKMSWAACLNTYGAVAVGRSGYRCGRVDMWDAETGRMMRGSSMKFRGEVKLVTVSPSGRYVIVVSWKGKLQMWDRTMNHAVPWVEDKSLLSVTSVAFSPDEEQLATGHGDETVRFWRVRSGCQDDQPLDVGSEILSLALSSDGQQLAVATGDGAHVWKVRSRERINTFPFGIYTTCVTFCQRDESVLSGNSDGLLRVLEVGRTPDKDEEPPFGHRNVVTFICGSPDGELLVSGSEDRTAIVWDAKRLVPRGPALEHNSEPLCGVVSTDSRLIAIGCSDGTVGVWDARACKQIGQPLRGNCDQVKSVTFSADGELLVSGSVDGTVRIWSITKQTPMGMAVGKLGNRVEMSGIGIGTASEGGSYSSGERNKDQKWDKFQCDDPVECVAITLDGRRVICSAARGKMFMWEIETAKVVCEEVGPYFGATHIQFREENRVTGISKYGLPMHWYIDEHRGLVRVHENKEEGLTRFFENEDPVGRYEDVAHTNDPRKLRWRADERTLATLPANVSVMAWLYEERNGMIVMGDENGRVNFYQLIK